MGLLKPAVNQTAFLKLGIFGFEGSGKTYTATEFAIGLTHLTKGTKVAFFDTETGSDFMIKKFKESKVQLDVTKSKSFKDLVEVVREAEAGGYSFLIIDSITHVWRELCNSYLKKKNRSNLSVKDWGTLKTEWAQYTDLYVNSKLHIAMLGRAGYEYDITEDEDGKQEVAKSGTKMKTETETGFEPSLLLEMIKVRKSEITNAQGKVDRKAKGFVNRCVVLKDRTDTMNARVIDSPRFKDFASVIKFLNLGGDHVGVDTTRNSEEMFGQQDRSWIERDVQRRISLDNIKECFILARLDGTSTDAKEKRIKTLLEVFGTSSWTFLEEKMALGELQAGVETLRQRLAPPPLPNLPEAPQPADLPQ